MDSPRGWDLSSAPNSSGTSPAGNSQNRKDTPELTQSQEIWLPRQTSSSCQDKCVMVKKPAVPWLFPARAVAGWATTRGAQGLCWASLARDQKHVPSPILFSGIQNCMALQTRSFISPYKPSTTLFVVMLTWHYSQVHLSLCCGVCSRRLYSSLPPLPSEPYLWITFCFQGIRKILLGSAPCWRL